ncbi:Serine/threonine protein kinase [Phytophthora megakarya]|uniref:Serine/threonine protein kinase n=1 Tax=Phytophthora megakarya TaxID=4795 RepID=A0A225WEN2_9STRA|nr:Serine/threonine protein kinase [Phytophthora megakarya]
MSIGDSNYHEDRDSCVILAGSPTGGESTQQPDTATSFSAGYVHLESPLDSHYRFVPANKRRQISRREERDSSRSLELLGTRSTASTTPAQTRRASRKTLRLALETLMKTKPNHKGVNAPGVLINTHQYSFSSDTQIEETPLAFFIDCRVSTSAEESSMTAPPSKLVLKIFIEDDADLAGRESYALSCLQHDDSTRAFAPRVHDVALEYELVSKVSKDGVKLSLNCCILVLEMPSCTTLRTQATTSREPTLQQISRVANAVQALHSRGLIHGALHTESLVACSPDARVKFWGLENTSRAGHTVPSPDADVLKAFQAEFVAPELASVALAESLSIRASPSLDVWSLGVMILKLYASDRPLEEFKGCFTTREAFERVSSSAPDEQPSNTCFFEQSIVQFFVLDTDMKDLLRRCFNYDPNSRPSIDTIVNHSLFQNKEREVCRPMTVKGAIVSRMLSAIIEEKDLRASDEPERETSGTEQLPEKIEDNSAGPVTTDEFVPEPLPPSLWLFLPPMELEIDLTQRASFFSVEQWISRLKHLKQQRGGELRFPLVFMCETCESHSSVQCSVPTTSKYGSTVTESLLCLVMPLVRETMLFLEARAILSNGLNVGEVCGLVGPHQWEELQSFYCALERMELATLNPVNEMELAPLQKQLKTRDPAEAQQLLDNLTQLVFSEEKREYVRNLLNALENDEAFATRVERSSWAALRRCDITGQSLSPLSQTRWLCIHHAPQEN